MSIPAADPSEWFDYGEQKPIKHHAGYGGMNARVRVIPVIREKKQVDKKNPYVNCTTSADDDGKRLSPFYLGPCQLYEGYRSEKLENAWQYSKLYSQHVDTNGKPTAEYFKWAKEGWTAWKAERYPFGKSVDSKLHWWDGHMLSRFAVNHISSC